MNDYKKIYELWKEKVTDTEIKQSLINMTDEDVKNAFSKDLSFGTGGLRGVMSAGTDRMNIYTVYRATEGLAKYMEHHGLNSCAVTYDSRLNSRLFSEITAATLASHGITVYITRECMPTPFLSFMVRYLSCDIGVNVTASHNPSDYNGYKVYEHHGCQLTDDSAMEVTEFIEKVDMFAKPLPVFENYVGNKILYADNGVEQAYLQNVLAQSIGNAEGLNAVYTPLNGAGYRLTPAALKAVGLTNLHVVAEQSYPDGRFTTCPYPNPEKAEALKSAIDLAKSKQADIVIANDPDSDRLGVAIADGGDFVQLTGNEVGVLLCDYILSYLSSNNALPQKPLVVKTIVTSPMVDAVAQNYGASVVDVLTGFKYIGDVINKLEAKGELNRYVFGFEESCGYLKGTYVRDKDGVVAAVLIAECAAFYKKQGKTLCGRLEELYSQYGNYLLETVSYRFEGADGAAVKEKLLSDLRVRPLNSIAGSNVTDYCDFLTQTTLDLPKSDVVRFFSQDGTRLIIRPSGTEPLIKCYVAVKGSKQHNAERLSAIKKLLNNMFLK